MRFGEIAAPFFLTGEAPLAGDLLTARAPLTGSLALDGLGEGAAFVFVTAQAPLDFLTAEARLTGDFGLKEDTALGSALADPSPRFSCKY